MKTTKRLISVGSVLLASTMLGACSADLDEVQGWMDQTRANTPRRVGKLDEPKNFVPFRYEARLDYDPFSDSKLAVAMANLTDRSRSGLAPDRNRRREVLENFPLDTVRLVGHLQNKTNGNVAKLSALIATSSSRKSASKTWCAPSTRYSVMRQSQLPSRQLQPWNP